MEILWAPLKLTKRLRRSNCDIAATTLGAWSALTSRSRVACALF
jgi:hypothetical protein